MRRITATVLLLVLFAACCISSHSCANTTTAPSGGPKDTLPPVLLKITPEPGNTEFPLTEGKITLLYNSLRLMMALMDRRTILSTVISVLLNISGMMIIG